MLGVTVFGLRGTALHSITKSDLRDVVRLYNISNRHFLIRMNNLDGKENSGFLELRVHSIVVLWLCTTIKRS